MKIADASRELNVSTTTIYRAIQKLKLDEHVMNEYGIKVLDTFALSKLKDHFQRSTNLKQGPNNVQDDSRLIEQLQNENEHLKKLLEQEKEQNNKLVQLSLMCQNSMHEIENKMKLLEAPEQKKKKFWIF